MKIYATFTAAVFVLWFGSGSVFADTQSLTLKLSSDYLSASEQIKILKAAVKEYAGTLSEIEPEIYPDAKTALSRFRYKRKSLGLSPLIELSGPKLGELVDDFRERVRKANVNAVARKLDSSRLELERFEKKLLDYKSRAEAVDEEADRRYELLSLEEFRTEAEIEKVTSAVQSLKNELSNMQFQYEDKQRLLGDLLVQLGSNPSDEIQTTQLMLFEVRQQVEELELELAYPSDRLVQDLQRELSLAEGAYADDKEIFGEDYGPLKTLKRRINRIAKTLDAAEKRYQAKIRSRLDDKYGQIRLYQNRLAELEEDAANYQQVRSQYYQIENSPPSKDTISELEQKTILLRAELVGLNRKLELIGEELRTNQGSKQRLAELEAQRNESAANIRKLEDALSKAERGLYSPVIEK